MVKRDAAPVTVVWVDPAQASLITGLSERQLKEMRLRSTGPAYYKPAHKCVRYKVADLHEFMERCRVAV